MESLETYSRVHRHFVTADLPPLLDRVARRGELCDLGCGDGAVLWALAQRGLVDSGFAVDLSPERVRTATAVVDGIRGVVADATRTGLPDACADAVIASQLIEHLPDDRALAREIARLLRPGGWWYVGSVIKLRHAWWIYKVDGVTRLDPTHVREYENVGQLADVLHDPQLVARQVLITPFRFAVADLVLRALARLQLLSPEQFPGVYRRSKLMRHVRRLRVRVPGYRLVEISGERP